MTTHQLPNDFARCDGVWDNNNWHWHRCCLNCLRRLAKRPRRCAMTRPPDTFGTDCEYRIVGETEQEAGPCSATPN